MQHPTRGWGGGSSRPFWSSFKANAKHAIPTLYFALVGCFLLLSAEAAGELKSGNGVGNGFPARQEQQAAYAASPKMGRRQEEPIPTAHLGSDGSPLLSQQNPELKSLGGKRDLAEEEGKSRDDNEGLQMLVKARQVHYSPRGTNWVELRVEVVGSDGKTNKKYKGGVAASLILAGSDETPVGSQDASLENKEGLTSERAVSIASSVATNGVALLHFSPPADGFYRFSITCGGCNHKLNTEKHYFSAGTHAVLKVTSQPSGASTGAILEHQPAVQLEDRYGKPLQVKSTIVANILPVNPHTSQKVPLDSWTLETDELGYARAKGILVTKAGQYIIQFVTTLWQDTRLEVSSASFEVVPGPASAAVFSLSPPPRVTCTLCAEDTPSSSAEIQVVSGSKVQVHHMPLLVENRITASGEGEMPSREFWGQLQISLRAENWTFGAPQEPVSVEVKKIALLSPLRGLTPEDGAKYLRVEPRRLVFTVENAAYPQVFYVLPWSPGVIVGSEGLSQPLSDIHIGAFCIELDVVSEDPSWSSASVIFDFPSPAPAPGVSLSIVPGPKDLTVYAKDSDVSEVLVGFPQQQLVQEGEMIAYTLRLSSRPLESEEVEVHVHAESHGGYSVKPELLQFNASNWNRDQTVWLQVDQDDIAPPGVGIETLARSMHCDKQSFEGSIIGNTIRTLVLHHEVSSSEKEHAWSMRGGKEVTFSVWDDDIAGLHCEGTQIIAHLEPDQAFEDASRNLNSSGGIELGKITVKPTSWQTEYEFLLHFDITAEGSDHLVAQSSASDAILHTYCSLNATSDDPNYDTGEKFTGQQHLLALRGFEIPLAISRVSGQSHIDGHSNGQAAAASIVTCVGGHYLRTTNSIVECLPCPPGYECPDPTEPPRPCPQEHMSLGGLSSCAPCPEGFTCPEGTAVPKELRPGFYYGISAQGDDVRISTSAAMPCPEGFYCTGGSASPVPCLPGYVSDTGASECIPCPAGYKCRTGRATDLEACPEGTYSLRGELACRPCPAGFACTVRRGGASKYFGDEPTAVGLSSNREEIDFRADDGKVDSHFNFAEQSVVELLLPCKTGYFSGDGDADCIPCGGPVACPTPFTKEHCFVPFAVALPDDPTECVPCPAGHTCTDGIVRKCPDFHYARLGEGVCRLCKGGYLCKGGATAPDEGDLVPIGYYRSERDAHLHPCPSGTLGLIPDFYQPNTGSTETKCRPCPSGYYTSKTGATACEGCKAGYYCTTEIGPLPCRYSTTMGTTLSERLDSCARRPGQFATYTGTGFEAYASCPEGTHHPDNILNEFNGLYSMEGFGSCISCPAGRICPGGAVSSTYDTPALSAKEQHALKDITVLQVAYLETILEDTQLFSLQFISVKRRCYATRRPRFTGKYVGLDRSLAKATRDA
ncbi:hypothetical protein, conserved [Eimeria brunetti]|uniref:GCC2 and GCC3 domain-containing protein n=1 Tax=Eimeria brunetti TaxID=51314 RepID=U6LMK4_9EIME|nr:hypothetical protein, conserved [Eimeria brunetti]